MPVRVIARAFVRAIGLAPCVVAFAASAASNCPVGAIVPVAASQLAAQAASSAIARGPLEEAATLLASGRSAKAREILDRLLADPALPAGDRLLARSLDAVARSADGEIVESARLARETVSAARDSGAPRTRAAVGANAAIAIGEAGDTKTARLVLQAAATDAAQAGDRNIEAVALADLALLESRAGGNAMPVARRALEAIARLSSPAQRTPLNAMVGFALLPFTAGPAEPERDALANDALTRAYRDASESRQPRDMAIALGLLGELRLLRGEAKAASEALERAVALSKAANDDPWLFRWHWRLGNARLALGDRAGAKRDLERAVAALELTKTARALGRYSSGSLARNYRGAYLDLADFLLAPDGDLDTATLKQARDVLERSRTAEIEDYFRDPCVAASARRVADIESIDPAVAVVYPVVFAGRTEILVGHRTGFTRFRVATGAVAMARESQRLRTAVEDPRDDRFLRPARTLEGWLVKPIAAHLDRLGVKTLVWVPDGPLRGVPFAALHDGERFLAERYALAVTPVASLVDPKPLATTSRRAVLTGLTEARDGFEALPSVADELSALSALLKAPVLKDKAFTVAALRGALESAPAAVVHVATHGQFATDASETFLLAYDGRLTLPQLREALAASKLREEPVELLTLSACQTAVGDERAALGLAGVALSSGARSALATLWSVNDESTALLITDFYQRLVTAGNSKSEALRSSQLALIRHKDFSHPAYWAPFILIGNWM